MAKSKSFGLKDTLNKNKKKKDASLAKKVELPKTDIELTKVSNEVNELHEEKKKKVRITVDLPNDLYIEMKMRTVQQRTTVRKYVWKLIEEDLNT